MKLSFDASFELLYDCSFYKGIRKLFIVIPLFYGFICLVNSGVYLPLDCQLIASSNCFLD